MRSKSKVQNPNSKDANISRSRDVSLRTFWDKLPKPFFVLAPMANVTDSVFRRLFAKYGKPDVTWTEFVSADGLMSPGKSKLLVDLKYSPKERPIVAQLFTGHPDAMRGAAALAAELGFDGIDINMGCPVSEVVRQGGGAALVRNATLALQVLNAAREGAITGACTGKIVPVSIKTRIGYNKVDMEWLRTLLEQRLPALTVHLRTRKEMSDVPAHWELMPEIVKLRDEVSPETLIIGNGDVETLDQAKEYIKKYGCDGVMIGRGIFGKPWFFSGEEKAPAERLAVMVEHARMFEKEFAGVKSFDVMKKHFKAYASGWDGAKELRIELMATKNAKEVKAIVARHIKQLRAKKAV